MIKSASQVLNKADKINHPTWHFSYMGLIKHSVVNGREPRRKGTIAGETRHSAVTDIFLYTVAPQLGCNPVGVAYRRIQVMFRRLKTHS